MLQAMNQSGLPISGTFAARGTVGGTTTRPMAMVSAQGSNLVAYDEQIGSLTADVRLDGRDVTVSELVIEKPQPDQAGRLTAKATYDLDRKTYTFDLQSQDLRLVGLLLPDGRRIRGDVQKLTAQRDRKRRFSGRHGRSGRRLTRDRLRAAGVHRRPAMNRRTTSQLGRIVISAVAKEQRGHHHGVGRTLQPRCRRVDRSDETMAGDRQASRRESRPGVTSRSASVDPKTSALQGQLRATIDASGNLTEPEKGQATVALEALDGTWNGRPFTVASPSPIRYADERLDGREGRTRGERCVADDHRRSAAHRRSRQRRDRRQPARQSRDRHAVPAA